jgi:hypothetical protein
LLEDRRPRRRGFSVSVGTSVLALDLRRRARRRGFFSSVGASVLELDFRRRRRRRRLLIAWS